MESPLITCVIPTYKKLDFLYDALDSVLQQNYPKIEIVVSDDGSDNFDARSIETYIENNNRGNVVSSIVHKNEINVGTVKNLNGAINLSHGEIIVPLSSDDQLFDDNVYSKIVEIFQTTHCEVLVYARVKYDEKMERVLGVIPSQASIAYIDRHMNSPYKQYIHMSRGKAMDFASGAALCYKKDYFDKIGQYDEEYFLWEDGPFIAKVTRNNTNIERRYDCILIKYRDGGISSSKKKNTVSKAYIKDVSNFYKREFVDHPEIIKGIRKIIPKGLYAYYSGNKIIIFKNLFFVIIGLINLCSIKVSKKLNFLL